MRCTFGCSATDNFFELQALAIVQPRLETHFTSRDLFFIATGLLLVAASIVTAARGKMRPALLLLIAGGFTLRLLMAIIDPFLNPWDEQFHALVAHNMLSHPFMPTLYENPVIPYHADDWCNNHV